MLTIDALAQEIRRVDGNHSLGAGALAEALYPFLTAALSALVEEKQVGVKPLETHLVGDVPIAFGLYAQGHIPAVEAALSEGADWQEIGRRIGWDGDTAKAYYERHLDRSALVDVPAVESEPVGYQQLKDGKWVECSHFVAFGWSDRLDKDCRPIYASPVLSALAPAPAGEDAWQTIETAPKDWTNLILFDDERDPPVFEGYFSVEDGGHNCWMENQGMGSETVNPTHWRPLPTPPSPSRGYAEDGSATSTKGFAG